MNTPWRIIESDVIVLGAGIVGVSVALHLQKRGRFVVLVDRRDPGEETSHGNAGLIERSSVIPYGFPRDLATILRYALNRSADVRWDWRFLPRIAPWLWRFWRESGGEALRRAAADMLPLVERSVSEHEILVNEAGLEPLLRRKGWIEAFRDARSFDAAVCATASLDMYGLRYAYLDRAELRRREPFVSEVLIGGIHWLDSATVSDPGGIVKGLAELFVGRGGVVLKADANGLRPEPCGWGLPGGSAGLKAREAVVALGPWSDAVYGRLGYRLPLAVKRGYHMHYRLPHDFTLARPIYDADGGFLLAPMRRGIRLTTGIEFAARDAPPSPVQLARAEPLAREVFPLGARVDPTAWMGARPCLPDMRPVIGPAPAHRGLWFAFGHNHHGFTLGPVTGRLLAEMMTGEKPFADPAPYSPARFDR